MTNHQELEEILERIREGMTTEADAVTLTKFLKRRYQRSAKKCRVVEYLKWLLYQPTPTSRGE